jgi:hypothetical protein
LFVLFFSSDSIKNNKTSLGRRLSGGIKELKKAKNKELGKVNKNDL